MPDIFKIALVGLCQLSVLLTNNSYLTHCFAAVNLCHLLKTMKVFFHSLEKIVFLSPITVLSFICFCANVNLNRLNPPHKEWSLG